MKEYIEREAAIESLLGLTIVDPAVAQYANAVCSILQDLPSAYVIPSVREESVELQALRRRVESLEGENADLRRSLFGPSALGGGGGTAWEGKEDRKTAIFSQKLYQCNRRQCGARCSWPTCRHTTDREYAVRPDAPEEDFEAMGGYLWQKVEEEA